MYTALLTSKSYGKASFVGRYPAAIIEADSVT